MTLAGIDQHKTPARFATAFGASRGALAAAWNQLSTQERNRVEAIASELDERGIAVVLLGDERYPPPLARLRRPPPYLFTWGNQDLLNAAGVGMCGSRNVSEQGLAAARACGTDVAERGLVVISGYAKGVDTETHLAALRSGGRTVIVLAEGITRFREKRVFRDVGLDPARVLVVSQFPPGAGWSVGSAMTRNGVIAGLGDALVVIEAGAAGGTFNAGVQALEMGVPVLALQFTSTETPAGNAALFERGARPIATRQELRRALDQVSSYQPNNDGEQQLSLDVDSVEG